MSALASHDNQVGLALAISSSIFIGSSFIVKKKGLIRARGSGQGAGEGGYAYLRESLWWIGLLTMIGGEIANFAAYAFAPAILVTPLGALSVLVSAVLAQWLLKEELLRLGKIGCGLCIVGSTVIVLNSPTEAEVESVDQISQLMLTNLGFQLYAVLVIMLSLALVFYAAPRWGKTHIMVYVTVCSLVGSLSVICVKGLGIAIKLSFEGSNQMGRGSTWIFVLLVAISVVTQMNYLNKALDTFNTAMVTPIYYVIFTTCTIAASTILFRGWGDGGPEGGGGGGGGGSVVPDSPSGGGGGGGGDDGLAAGYNTGSLITCLCGFATIFTGVLLLNMSRTEAMQRAGGGASTVYRLGGGRRGREISHEAIMMTDLDREALMDSAERE
eukprot:UC1_evm1s2121